MEGIEIIRYDKTLQKAFEYIVKNNKSNHLPYHNITHLLTVLKYSDAIAHGEGVYFDQRMDLHLAALFHDVNHSGGELSDEENIKNAKMSFLKFAEENKINPDIVKSAIQIIEVTQYPYVHPESQLNLKQKIIRDADMMQAFEYNWVNQVTMGLATEFKQSIEEFVPKQRIFLESVTFRTKTAKSIKESRWINTMNQFRILEVSLGINKREEELLSI
jgi:predicted metal-dependent HD superfamily phosphohydrolase